MKLIERLEQMYRQEGKPTYEGAGFEFESTVLNALPEIIAVLKAAKACSDNLWLASLDDEGDCMTDLLKTLAALERKGEG